MNQLAQKILKIRLLKNFKTFKLKVLSSFDFQKKIFPNRTLNVIFIEKNKNKNYYHNSFPFRKFHQTEDLSILKK